MLQCWAHKPEDRPTFVALRDFLVEVGVGWRVSGGPRCPFPVQSEGKETLHCLLATLCHTPQYVP